MYRRASRFLLPTKRRDKMPSHEETIVTERDRAAKRLRGAEPPKRALRGIAAVPPRAHLWMNGTDTTALHAQYLEVKEGRRRVRRGNLGRL